MLKTVYYRQVHCKYISNPEELKHYRIIVLVTYETVYGKLFCYHALSYKNASKRFLVIASFK